MHNPGLHTPYWMNVLKLCLLKHGYLFDSVENIQVWNCTYADSKLILMFKTVSGLLSERHSIVHRVSRSGIACSTQIYDTG